MFKWRNIKELTMPLTFLFLLWFWRQKLSSESFKIISESCDRILTSNEGRYNLDPTVVISNVPHFFILRILKAEYILGKLDGVCQYSSTEKIKLHLFLYLLWSLQLRKRDRGPLLVWSNVGNFLPTFSLKIIWLLQWPQGNHESQAVSAQSRSKEWSKRAEKERPKWLPETQTGTVQIKPRTTPNNTDSNCKDWTKRQQYCGNN